jgi:Fic family protein
MVDNIRVADKSLKEILEMQGHDKVMLDILKIGRGEFFISEKRIKEIHQSITYEIEPPKQILIGNWKTSANEIINSKHEKFQFLPPDEVPDAMHKLLNFLNAEIEKINRRDKKATHPIQLSADFHLKLLAIHPFFDGNGRIARLLSNLILISNGFPPFYILDTEKDTYYRLITDVQSYGGDHLLFIEFIAKTVERSLKNVLQLIDNQ